MSRDDKGRLIERTLAIYEPEARIVRQVFPWFAYDDLTTYDCYVCPHRGPAMRFESPGAAMCPTCVS